MRVFLHILLLFALLGKALIPAGYMPAGKTGLALVVCTGTGPQTITLGPDGQPVQDTPPTAAQACHYAVAAHVILTPPAMAEVRPLVAGQIMARSLGQQGQIIPAPCRDCAARAPPRLV